MQRIFVVGCPRSGTTLIQALIARHPDVFSLRETYFFEALLGDAKIRWGDRDARSTRRWYHRAGMAQSWGRRRLRELEGVHLAPHRRWPVPRRWSACVQRYTAMLDHAARSQGRSHWVEKTPSHLLFIDEIAACIPDARFVHVLRNGIDVVASAVDEDMRQDTAAFCGGLAQWAHRWNHAMELHIARLGDPRHHLLCLEDLVVDQRGGWERLRDFVQLDPGKTLMPEPDCAVADAESEPWKRDAMMGVVKSAHGKAQGMFGPQSLTWLRQHLTDYQAIRDSVRRYRRTAVESTAEVVRMSQRRNQTARH